MIDWDGSADEQWRPKKIAAEYRDWLPQRFWARAPHCVACPSNYPCPIKGSQVNDHAMCSFVRDENLWHEVNTLIARGTNSIQPFRP